MSAAEILPFGQRILVTEINHINSGKSGARLSRDGRWAIYEDQCMTGYGIGKESPTIEDCVLFYNIMDSVSAFRNS